MLHSLLMKPEIEIPDVSGAEDVIHNIDPK